MTTATVDRTSGSTLRQLQTATATSGSTLKVLPHVRSPVAVVIYTDTHTYKQKVLLYSKFMFNSKATANGDRYVREYLQGLTRGLLLFGLRTTVFWTATMHIVEKQRQDLIEPLGDVCLQTFLWFYFVIEILMYFFFFGIFLSGLFVPSSPSSSNRTGPVGGGGEHMLCKLIQLPHQKHICKY